MPLRCRDNISAVKTLIHLFVSFLGSCGGLQTSPAISFPSVEDGLDGRARERGICGSKSAFNPRRVLAWALNETGSAFEGIVAWVTARPGEEEED